MSHKHLAPRSESSAITARMRKMLFVAGAYLAVSFALLVLVSYGQYKISIDGVANMPVAAGIEACLDLDSNLSETVSLSEYLTDLQPGDSARTYASAYSANSSDTAALNHKMQVKVTNSSTTVTNQGGNQVTTTVESELDLEYTLRIYSSPGRIPMQFILIDSENNKYISKRQTGGKEYRFYKLTGTGNNETVSNTEASFTLEASNGADDIYQIFAGWDNTPEDATSLTDAAYRKEVEMLELHVDVKAGTTGSTIKPESDLQAAIPIPQNNA